jgi:hypothetical protein
VELSPHPTNHWVGVDQTGGGDWGGQESADYSGPESDDTKGLTLQRVT